MNDSTQPSGGAAAAGGGAPAAGMLGHGGGPSRGVDALTDFRTAWLRAIAQAWIDERFAKQLIRDPKKALTSFDFTWPWEGNMELTVRPEPEFIWVANNWVWPDNEQREEGLILYVPLVPPVDPLDHAAALADYYRQRPGLLVSSTSGAVSGDLNLNAFRFNDRIANEFTDRLSGAGGIGNVTLASQASPGRGFIPNEVDFLDFGVVLTSLMAKAWESPLLRDLLGNPRNLKAFSSTVRGYTPPWALNLFVRNDEGKDGKGVVWNKAAKRWDNLSAYQLLLHLPAAPIEAKERSLALAAYNATGAEFFATCCV